MNTAEQVLKLSHQIMGLAPHLTNEDKELMVALLKAPWCHKATRNEEPVIKHDRVKQFGGVKTRRRKHSPYAFPVAKAVEEAAQAAAKQTDNKFTKHEIERQLAKQHHGYFKKLRRTTLNTAIYDFVSQNAVSQRISGTNIRSYSLKK